MTDIVERLRVVSPDDYDECCSVMSKAADEIERLRSALRAIVAVAERRKGSTAMNIITDCGRQALEGK